MLRANQANLQGVLPTGNVPTVGNEMQKGWDQAQQRRDNEQTQQMRVQEQQARMEDRQVRRDQTKQRARMDVLSQMADDPVNAEQIARMNGIQYDDNMRQLFSNKEMASLTVEGAKVADSIGIANPDTAREFVKAYVGNRGNVLAANEAIQGMESANPKDHLMSAGGSIIDTRTGRPIYEAPDNRQPKPPSTTGLSDGLMWQGGEAVPIPGYAFDIFTDPSLPQELRAEGEVLKAAMKNNPMGARPDQMQAFIQKVNQYRQNPTPNGMPPLPSLEAQQPEENSSLWDYLPNIFSGTTGEENNGSSTQKDYKTLWRNQPN